MSVVELVCADREFTVDMVTVCQVYPLGCPPLGSRRLVGFPFPLHPSEKRKGDPDVVSESIFGASFVFPGGGTFWFCCDGRSQRVRFNPSHLGRSHSLDGVSSFEGLVEMANACLDVVGDRPPFTEGDVVQVWDEERQRFVRKPEACYFSRVDLAQLLSAGDASSLSSAIDALSVQYSRGCKPQVTKGESLGWNYGSRRVKTRLYGKAKELRRNHPECPPDVVAWCEAQGVLRHEVELESMKLDQLSLRVPGHWSQEVAWKLLDDYSFHARGEVMVTFISEIYERAVALGWTKRRAYRAQDAAEVWSRGEDFRRRCSKPTFYAVRRDLLLFGIDISGVCDVEASAALKRPLYLAPIKFPKAGRPEVGTSDQRVMVLPPGAEVGAAVVKAA